MGKKEWKKVRHEGGGAVYGLGFVGALVYFLQQATTLWEGMIGLLKSLFWPAVLIYKLLEFLKI
jgi:hypothetical protein